jgi:hypothetical protein
MSVWEIGRDMEKINNLRSSENICSFSNPKSLEYSVIKKLALKKDSC